MLVYPSPRRVAAHRGIGLSDNSGQKAAALSSLFIAAGRSLGLGRLPPPGLLGIAAAAERTQGSFPLLWPELPSQRSMS